MRTALLLLHLIGGLGIAAALLSWLLVAGNAPATALLLPALALLAVSGLLMIAQRPALLERRWLLLKLLLASLALSGIAIARQQGSPAGAWAALLLVAVVVALARFKPRLGQRGRPHS